MYKEQDATCTVNKVRLLSFQQIGRLRRLQELEIQSYEALSADLGKEPALERGHEFGTYPAHWSKEHRSVASVDSNCTAAGMVPGVSHTGEFHRHVFKVSGRGRLARTHRRAGLVSALFATPGMLPVLALILCTWFARIASPGFEYFENAEPTGLTSLKNVHIVQLNSRPKLIFNHGQLFTYHSLRRSDAPKTKY